MPDAYGIEAFNFNKLFSGAKERRPRWKRAIEMEEDAMGEMLGQLYVKEFFNETAKKRYTDMVEDIRAALKDRIAKLTWMGDSTKQKAYAKLAAIKSKVGYPDKWKDFSTMEIGRESLCKKLHELQNCGGIIIITINWANRLTGMNGSMYPQTTMPITTPATMKSFYLPAYLPYPVTVMKNWMMQLYMVMPVPALLATKLPMALMIKEGSLMKKEI